MTIAMDSLIMSAARVREQFNAAAVRLSTAGLPRAPEEGAPAPAPDTPPDMGDVDVAEQLVTMMVSQQMHRATTVALRAAMSMYRDSIELVRPADD